MFVRGKTETVKGRIKTADFDKQGFKAVDGEERIIEGYFTTKDPDRINDVALPSAFEETMKSFMENPIVVFMHNWNKAMGKILDYTIDDTGVKVRVKIAKGVSWIDEQWELIKQGIIKGFSFGYKTLDSEPGKINGKAVNILKKIDLLEVSVVTLPMNSAALFAVSPKGRVKGITPTELEPDADGSCHVFATKFNFRTAYFSEEGVKAKMATLPIAADAYQIVVDAEKKTISAVLTDDARKVLYDEGIDDEFFAFPGVSVEVAGDLPEEKTGSGEESASIEGQEPAGDAPAKTASEPEPTSEPSEKAEGESDTISALMQERTDRVKNDLWEIWYACHNLMLKVDCTDQKKAQSQLKKLIDEFSGLAKTSALSYVMSQQEMMREMEGSMGFKAGRVLSSTNRTKLTTCRDVMGKGIEILTELLDATDDSSDDPAAEPKDAQIDDTEQKGGDHAQEDNADVKAAILELQGQIKNIVTQLSS